MASNAKKSSAVFGEFSPNQIEEEDVQAPARTLLLFAH